MFGRVLGAAVGALIGKKGPSPTPDGISNECTSVRDALSSFRTSKAQCRIDSCACLDLQQLLLLKRAARLQPELDTLIGHRLHVLLPGYFEDIKNIKYCPHRAATRLAVADAFYKLIAMPQYRCREQAAAAAAPAAPAPGGLDAVQAGTEDSPIELITKSYAETYPAVGPSELRAQWTKVLRRLQKAVEKLPPDNQPLSAANASTLSKWICEGPKGIDRGTDGQLDTLMLDSHTLILWAAAVCRICKENIFIGHISPGCPPAAVSFVAEAAELAACMLDVTCTMGRLSAAGISFSTQPSPAAVAAAIDLAAQVTAALSPYQYATMRKEKEFFEQHQQQQQQQHGVPQPLPLLPLYLHPLQQQQQQTFTKSLAKLRRLGEVAPQGEVPRQAHIMLQNCTQFWALGAPVICLYGLKLLQRWEQQLQQQGGVAASCPAAAAAAAAAAGGGGSSGSCDGSSSSRPAWQEAEGVLLLRAAALEGSHHQHPQQQLALCRHYQQQFQQAASSLGLSSELMAGVAACFAEEEQFSSSDSSSEGAAAGSNGAAAAAAAACHLSTICAASLLLSNVFASIDPMSRAQMALAPLNMRRFTAAEELLVADFFLQAPGLLSAAAGVASSMASAGEAAAVGPGAAACTGPVLLQVPLLAHTLQLYQKTWPSLSRLLCGQLAAEEQAAMEGAGEVWKQHQKLQIVRRRLCSTSSTTVSCCWQLDGQPQQNAAAVAAAAGLVLLGNNSILLQQLLRTTSAAAESQQQQEQLVSAVLYCADSLGDQVGGLWADVVTAAQGQHDSEVLVSRGQASSVIALAVQAFEAAVRLLGSVGTPRPAAAAAGSALPANRSRRGRNSSSSRPAVPPSIIQAQLAAVGIYLLFIEEGSEAGSSSSSGGSKRSITSLHCREHELLQAVLSMLLTSAKVWQAGLLLPLPVELLWKVATPASACVKLAQGPPAAASAPSAVAAAAKAAGAAAAAAAAEAAGGAQVCHLVTRYLSCLERHLRKWVASEDAHAASGWLSGNANQDITPLPVGGTVWGHVKAAGAGPRRLQAIALIVQASCVIACGAGWDSAEGLGVQRGADRVDTCYRDTLAQLVKLLQAEGLRHSVNKGASLSREMERQLQWLNALQSALLESIGALADALQGYASALAAAVPSRFGCNWPGCVRLSGVSEGYGLVRGQACVCGGCRQARYCSVACQAAHWPAHKIFCQQHQQQREQQQQQQQRVAVAASVAAAATGT